MAVYNSNFKQALGCVYPKQHLPPYIYKFTLMQMVLEKAETEY
jgi:hypothetical protein